MVLESAREWGTEGAGSAALVGRSAARRLSLLTTPPCGDRGEGLPHPKKSVDAGWDSSKVLTDWER
jgi:hypothetical protein